VRKGDDLTTFIVPKVEKIRSLNLPYPHGPAQAFSGKTLPVFLDRCLHIILRLCVFRTASRVLPKLLRVCTHRLFASVFHEHYFVFSLSILGNDTYLMKHPVISLFGLWC
jgi:hypothetical protein